MKPMPTVMLSLALCLSPALAWSQKAYKCGGGYSDTPCPGGVPVATDDTRTASQKAQADASTQRQAKLADGLEKERMKAQQSAAKDMGRPAAAPKPAPAASDAGVRHIIHPKKKKKEPDYFTAQVHKDGKAAKKAAPPQSP